MLSQLFLRQLCVSLCATPYLPGKELHSAICNKWSNPLCTAVSTLVHLSGFPFLVGSHCTGHQESPTCCGTQRIPYFWADVGHTRARIFRVLVTNLTCVQPKQTSYWCCHTGDELELVPNWVNEFLCLKSEQQLRVSVQSNRPVLPQKQKIWKPVCFFYGGGGRQSNFHSSGFCPTNTGVPMFGVAHHNQPP